MTRGPEWYKWAVFYEMFVQACYDASGDGHGDLPVEMTGLTPFPVIGARPYQVTLPGYGSFWFPLTVQTSEQRVSPVSPLVHAC